MSTSDTYEVYAVKYATHEGRSGTECFIGGDPHEGPGELTYYVWAVVNDKRTFIVDLGMTAEAATRRGRTPHRTPAEGLAGLGIDAASIEEVIVTHMHYDHVGTWSDFPNARFHLQEREIKYATGPCMAHPPLRVAYDIEDVCTIVRDNYQGRVIFHDGDEEIAPGVSIHLVGGHAHGLQFARVWTQNGWLVLASDAAHYYENFQQQRPFPIADSISEMVLGWEKLKKLADTPENVIPGHDPQVMKLYAAASHELEGIAVRLDTGRTK